MIQSIKKKLIFDTSALIAGAQFATANQLVIQYVLDYACVMIPEKVKEEAVDQGLQAGYPDALVLDALYTLYTQGDITLRGMARRLGVSYRELYHLFEEK